MLWHATHLILTFEAIFAFHSPVKIVCMHVSDPDAFTVELRSVAGVWTISDAALRLERVQHV
jgi:hypothetical protein